MALGIVPTLMLGCVGVPRRLVFTVLWPFLVFLPCGARLGRIDEAVSPKKVDQAIYGSGGEVEETYNAYHDKDGDGNGDKAWK